MVISDRRFEIVGPEQLATLSARLGLAHWLIGKAH
jgi:hypothetical protein